MWKRLFNTTKGNDSQTDKDIFSHLEPDKLPAHVAIIMDGNGRWAKGQGLVRTAGHRAGVSTLKQIVKSCSDLNIEALTVYAFSTENWKRPPAEVEFLMALFSEFMDKEIEEMVRDNVCLRFIGRINELSKVLQDKIANAVERTRSNTGVKFTIAVNYGGKDELIRAIQTISSKVSGGELDAASIDDSIVDSHLDTAGLPPVDFVIRTSGDIRLSNFLLWQTAYAEFWFTSTNWPDFTPECFAEALYDFSQRERRFGGLKEKK